MSGGRLKASGKSHNKSLKTWLTAGRDQASTSNALPVTGMSSIIKYFKRPAENQVEIEDEEDENVNDN